jgi:hypothetical protein
MIPAGRPPVLSVVVVAFNTTALLERCLDSLERQTVRDGVEILVARPWDAPAPPNAVTARFRRARWVRDPGAQTVPQLRGLGIAESRGTIVALLEDDCVAPETWCAALLDAHRGACVAVGGAVEPGDYAALLDWAMYFLEYVRFMQPLPSSASEGLPGTNVSYKRGAVLPHLQADGIGFYEVFVHAALLQAGLPVKLDPALVVYNVNSWKVARAVRSRFHHGRGFAAVRVGGRPLARRLPFLAIAAVLPVVQIARTAREVVSRRRRLGRLAAALPWIVVLSVSWSLGEFAGYLMGPGGSLAQWR